MGCDIHAHVEVKIEGQWHHYAKPNVNRNYALFGRMAGVRGEGEPISEPRGMPNDATFMTLFDRKYWDTDGHSDSWLSSDEVASLNEWVKSFGEQRAGFFAEMQFGFIFGNGWNVKKYPDDYPKGLEDARLVFWFDNQCERKVSGRLNENERLANPYGFAQKNEFYLYGRIK